MPDLVDVCAAALGTSRSVTLAVARSAPHRFKRFEIKKRSGGVRTIWQAAVETKGLHYPIIDAFLKNLPLHSASQAFSPGSSIKKNADAHRGNAYFLRIDLADFFPSITFAAFRPLVVQSKELFSTFDPSTRDSLFLLEKACFDRSSRLPIGYATSPFIANHALYDLDRTIVTELNALAGGNAIVYTRYADDLVFSTNVRGACREIYVQVKELIQKYNKIRLIINEEKTRFGSAAKGTAFVTGVHVLTGDRLAAPMSLRADARFLLALSKKKVLSQADKKRLIGLLAHIRHIDPRYYTKLAADFFSVFPY